MTAPRDDLDQPVKPTPRRRALAILALVALVLTVLGLLGWLLSHPGWLLAALVGLAMTAAGAWTVVAGTGPHRTVGIVTTVLGVMLLLVVITLTATNLDVGLVSGLVTILVLAGMVAAARGALMRSTADLERQIAGLEFRPDHPVLICNPRSGGGKAASFDLPHRADRLGVEVVELLAGDDLERLARDAVARGADCLGMAGGDGSLGLVAAVAIEHRIPFVCIPAGTRNHFAQDLGLDREAPDAALAAFTDGVLRYLDHATVNDQVFLNNVSLGVYAAIVADDDYRDAKLETAAARLHDLLGDSDEPFDLRFSTPDGAALTSAFLVLVSNNPYVFGLALDAAQRRTITTGLLGVVAVTTSTGAEATALLARLTVNLGSTDPNLHRFTVPAFRITSGDTTLLAGIDGESAELDTPLMFRIHPGGLPVLVPRASLLTAERRRVRGVQWRALLDLARGRPPRMRS